MLTTFPQKTFVQVGRVSVAQVQGLRRTEGLCLPGGFLFQLCFRKKRNLKGSCLLTKVSQIEGQLLPEAALELTKLEKDALLQVLWKSKTPFILNPRCSSVLDAQREMMAEMDWERTSSLPESLPLFPGFRFLENNILHLLD